MELLMKKFLAALLLLCCTAAPALAQNAITLPIAANAVADLGNGPIKARMIAGNASIFTSQSSGVGSTSGSSATLTLTTTPATAPLVGGLISGAGIASGTTVAAYNGTTGITLSAAMTVPGGTTVSWGAACPSSSAGIPSVYIQASASAGFYIMYTQARACAVSPGGPVNTLLIEPVYYEQTAPTVPSTINKIANEWLDSYSAVTGLFTQSQPGFSNLSGSATFSQLPSTAAASLNGNPTGSSGTEQNFAITSLVASVSPNAASDYLPIYDSATGTIKRISPSAIVSTGCPTATLSQIGCSAPDGFTLEVNSGILDATSGVANIRLPGVTTNTTVTVPAGYRVSDICFTETAGHAVTGGINIGTTSGGTDVVSGFAVGAFSFNCVGSSLLKHTFSQLAATPLYIQAASAWNSASVNVVFSVLDGGLPLGSLYPGYIGYWPMDQWTSTPRPTVANAAAPSIPLSSNVFGGSRRLFSNTSYWAVTGATVTDNAALDANGNMQATTITAAGNWYIQQGGSDNLPAGTWTICVQAKINTGTSAPMFALSGNFGTTRAVKTATSSWAPYGTTFTTGGEGLDNVIIGSYDGSTGSNIQITDFELYQGTITCGAPQALAGHLYLGLDAFSSSTITGTYSNGWLDVSSGGYGTIQFPLPQTVTTFTGMAYVSKVSAGALFQSFLSQIQNANNFTIPPEIDGLITGQILPYSQVGTSTQSFNQGYGGLWNFLNVGPHVIGQTYDGTNLSLWLDDIRIATAQVTTSISAISDIWFNIVVDAAEYSGYKYNAMVLYPFALTPAQYRQNVSYLENRASLLAITQATDRIYMPTGDSLSQVAITSGVTSGGGWPYLYGAVASPAVLGINWAVSGVGLAYLQTQLTSPNGGLLGAVSTFAGRKIIVSVLIGANDQSWPGGPSAYATALAAYCDQIRAAGYKVALATLLPQTTAGFNTFRDAVNTIIYSWSAGQHYDTLIDFAGNAIIGIDGNGSTTGPWNTTNYNTDGKHLTVTGQGIAESVAAPVLNGM